MATIQVRVDDNLKTTADSLFASLGLDTSTAVRMFIVAAIEHDGIPFAIRRVSGGKAKKPNAELREAIEDIRLNRNIYGPFDTASDAVVSIYQAGQSV